MTTYCGPRTHGADTPEPTAYMRHPRSGIDWLITPFISTGSIVFPPGRRPILKFRFFFSALRSSRTVLPRCDPNVHAMTRAYSAGGLFFILPSVLMFPRRSPPRYGAEKLWWRDSLPPVRLLVPHCILRSIGGTFAINPTPKKIVPRSYSSPIRVFRPCIISPSIC